MARAFLRMAHPVTLGPGRLFPDHMEVVQAGVFGGAMAFVGDWGMQHLELRYLGQVKKDGAKGGCCSHVAKKDAQKGKQPVQRMRGQWGWRGAQGGDFRVGPLLLPLGSWVFNSGGGVDGAPQNWGGGAMEPRKTGGGVSIEPSKTGGGGLASGKGFN